MTRGEHALQLDRVRGSLIADDGPASHRGTYTNRKDSRHVAPAVELVEKAPVARLIPGTDGRRIA